MTKFKVVQILVFGVTFCGSMLERAVREKPQQGVSDPHSFQVEEELVKNSSDSISCQYTKLSNTKCFSDK